MKKVFLLAVLLFSFSVFVWGDPQLDSLSRDISYLKMKDDVYTNFFNSIEGVLNTYLLAFTVLTVLLLGFQIWVARNEKKMSEEIRQNFSKSISDQEANNQRLLESVIRNIDQTTKFIDSYSNLVGIQQAASEIGDKLKKFEDRETEQRKSLREVQKDKNAKAMRLIKTVFKANFGASFFNNFDRGKFHGFFVEMSPHLVSLETGDEMEINWNADVYFLIGLNHFLDGQSRDAEKYLEKAVLKAENFIKNPPENTNILFPEKELLTVNGGVDGWNKMLYGKCVFYSGVNQYRLGRFTLATKEFEKAIQYAPEEREPHFFLYQSRYWDRAFDHFPTAMHEMASSLSKIIDSDNRKDEKTKKMVLARLYKKIGDFYLPSEKDDRYVTEKDLKKALEWYEKAYNLVQEVNGDLQNIPQGHAQFVPMVYFALGKSLRSANKSKPKSPDSLFKETEMLCEQVIPDIQNPETRYILYYTLAYCQHQLGKHREAGFNVALALVELDRFCSNPSYWGYSPIHNIMLPSQQLREELNAFKLELFKRA